MPCEPNFQKSIGTENSAFENNWFGKGLLENEEVNTRVLNSAI